MLNEGLVSVDCFDSNAPKDEDLLRYALDDELLAELPGVHLKSCRLCQQRLARYDRANRFLLTQCYRSQCPDTARLSYYCAGYVSEREEKYIVGHLKICPLCASDLAEMRKIFVSDLCLKIEEIFYRWNN